MHTKTVFSQPAAPGHDTDDGRGGYPMHVYVDLVDVVVRIRSTEKRQEKARSYFPNDADYVKFMKLVQYHVDDGAWERKSKLNDYADEYLLPAEAKELAKQRREDALRAASGVHQQSVISGADFILDAPETPVAVWGDGNDALLAEGEALMLVGKAGVGKTTIADQFIKARLGITDKALGYTVQPTRSNVLYLACDRPQQAARAMRRLFSAGDREALSRLKVWSGPPPFDFAQHTNAMLNMCLEADADTIIVDSLKDVAIGLSEDNIGSAYNRARQLCLVNGITVIELHHQVKRGANGASPNTIADVYGSTWLTAGAGSVILIDGDAGDPVVTLKHLKQPLGEIGPVEIIHDHETGISVMADKADLLALAQRTAISALDAAKVVFDTDKPSRAEKEKARRKLEKLVNAGHLRVITGGVGRSDTYVPRLAVTSEAKPDGDTDAGLWGDD
jgi:replicative DNA helicase